MLPVRIELLNALDQQIDILMDRPFGAFTAEERSQFKNRQQRIRDLERCLALAQSERIDDGSVFAGIYK